ncbi:MAG: HhH-GPD-type base excision DNA repair protein [Microthrixaceae bacterium]|nr:Fe-S cluster assembly protein HesB [Microthrixaceae bacterium]
MAEAKFPITGDDADDALLLSDPFALLLGMLLDQQVPMEWAFRSPARLRERMEAADPGSFSPAGLAALGEDRAVELFAEKPALHRYPKSMGKRAHAVAQALVDDYEGDAAALWHTATDGADLYRRLRALPGYGEEKAKIFVALLAKRLDVRPEGWEQAAGVFADDTPRSAADVGSADELTLVRQWKQAQKRKGKTKQQ